MSRRFVKFLLVMFFATAISGYGWYVFWDIDQQKTHKKLFVVCTTGMIADVVQHIAGDLVELYTLMGPGIDPHLYRVKEGDVHQLARANVVIYNGLHLEGKIVDVLQVLPNARVHAAATAIDAKKLIHGGSGISDPHVWHDVSLWKQVARGIGTLLIDVDPDNGDVYVQRGQVYEQTLDTLEHDIKQIINQIATEKRVLVTAHDAFSYFGKAYGFTVLGLQGISTDADISTKDIQSLADYIVLHKVKALFVEASVAHRNMQALHYAVSAHGWAIAMGGILYSDSLGDSTSDARTYQEMIMHNVVTIVEALR